MLNKQATQWSLHYFRKQDGHSYNTITRNTRLTEANHYMLVRVLIQGSQINEIGGITCSEERLHSIQHESRSGQTQ